MNNKEKEELIYEVALVLRKVAVTKELSILFYRTFALQIIALFKEKEGEK